MRFFFFSTLKTANFDFPLNLNFADSNRSQNKDNRELTGGKEYSPVSGPRHGHI